ncbi:hypothetical protein RJ641_021875 [Dillenia turbinata]|uniref:Uncharacterized protein n=1 Tax=Dillenia turbinata TaxID=194707 RepID=A0AAN8UKQ2_9MAGN
MKTLGLFDAAFSWVKTQIALRSGDEERENKMRVVEKLLGLIDESISWVKAQVENFFKLLRESLTNIFVGFKSLVISCSRKLAQVLTEINGLIDAGKARMSVTTDPLEERPENQNELIYLSKEMKKLLPVVSSLAEMVDSVRGTDVGTQKVKVFTHLVDGFVELLDLGLKRPLCVIPILIDGFSIHLKGIRGISRKIPIGKGKGAAAIATLLALNAYARIWAKKFPKFHINAIDHGYVKTDINGNNGVLTVEEGAKGAMTPDDGPTVLFFDRMEVTAF